MIVPGIIAEENITGSSMMFYDASFGSGERNTLLQNVQGHANLAEIVCNAGHRLPDPSMEIRYQVFRSR